MHELPRAALTVKKHFMRSQGTTSAMMVTSRNTAVRLDKELSLRTHTKKA
jgi:hypothetical protein